MMGKVKTGRVTRSKQAIQSFKRECKCKFHVFSFHLRWLINKGYMTVENKLCLVIV